MKESKEKIVEQIMKNLKSNLSDNKETLFELAVEALMKKTLKELEIYQP